MDAARLVDDCSKGPSRDGRRDEGPETDCPANGVEAGGKGAEGVVAGLAGLSGEGCPAVILLHGFAQTPASWDAIAQGLRDRGHRVCAPDLYRRAGDSLDQLCAAMAAMVADLAQTEGACALIGYSMGGRIAAETVVRNPGLPLAGLFLESAGLGPADERERAVLADRNAAWAGRLRVEGVDAFMDWWETLPLFSTQRLLPEVTRAALRSERMAHGAEPLARSLEAWGAQHQATEAATLSTFADLAARGVSVSYLAGALDGKYAAAASRVRAFGLPAVVVPDAGHNVHLEAPIPFLEKTTEFLA